MRGRQLLGLLVAGACAAAVYFAWPRQERSAEDQVRDCIAGMVHAAEQRDPAGVVAGLSEAFKGQGGADKAEVQRLMAALLLRRGEVGVLNPSLDVQLSSAAEAHFKGTFVFTGESGPLGARRYEINGTAILEDGAWRVSAATWNAR